MDVTAQDDLKAHLMSTDEHFRQLAAEHGELDGKLHELEGKNSLSQDEQMEEVRLKKLKLRLKDEMAQIMNRSRVQHVS